MKLWVDPSGKLPPCWTDATDDLDEDNPNEEGDE